MKKILVFLAVMTFMLSFVAAGTNDTIVKAADRIINLQDTDGSWDWTVTDNTTYTGTTYRNIAGVTAEVLLDAYKLTGESKYLNAAKATGDYIKGVTISPTNRYNAFNINFLYHLYDATGIVDYKNHADALMNHILNETNYWSSNNGNHCGIGCTPSGLLDALRDYRGATSTTKGIVVWDLYNFIEAGQRYGDDSFADTMASVLQAYMDDASFNSSIDYYVLGISGGIIGLEQAGINTSSYVTKLLNEQDTDSSFDRWVQDTAYALMALKAAGQTGAVSDAGSYLLDSFGYNDPQIDGWLDDGVEYSEVTSEAAQALYDAIGSEQQTEGTLSSWFWSISVTPSTLSFGTIPRGKSITDPADNGPVIIYTTGSDTESNNTWIAVDVVESENFYTGLLELEVDSSWQGAKGSILIIPEDSSEDYEARLFGDTTGISPGAKSATIVYTAYGEALPL